MVAPTFGGIDNEDIAAPRCFEIERRLRDELWIPGFHETSTAPRSSCSRQLLNALRVVGKRAEDVRVVTVGANAAGIASAKRSSSPTASARCSSPTSKGVLYPGRANMDPIREELARRTNPRPRRQSGSDVVIGLSGPRSISAAAVRQMAAEPIVFAMANPIPEIQPEEVAKDVAIMAAGRSDYPNEINNVLAFPGARRRARRPRDPAINET